MKRITKPLFFILLFFSCYSSYSQHSEFPSLEKRIDNSSMIVEGKVVEQETYYDSEKDLICTANKVKIYKQFKGEYSKDYFTIITKGGELGDLIQYTSHSFQLQNNDFGIFFLNKNLYYEHELSTYPDEVFHGHPNYGFLRYAVKKNKIYTKDVLQEYTNIEKQLLQRIEIRVGNQRIIKSSNPIEKQIDNWITQQTSSADNNSVENVVEYTIENPSLTGALNQYLEFDLNIASLLTSEKFFNGEILIDYNSLSLGTNLASSGILTVNKGTVILTPNYTLNVTDISPSQLKITVSSASNNPNTLYLINNSSEQLVHLKIDLTNLAGNTGIDFDEINMQGLSEFFDISTSTGESFDLVKANDKLHMDFSAFMTPSITSIYPTEVKGGIDTLYIYGQNFGDTLTPTASRVEFQNAHQASGWSKPFETDYILWSDTLIIVKVPSVGVDPDGIYLQQDENIAGTGVIRVFNLTQYSQNVNLKVKFSIANLKPSGIPTIPHVLVNRNGIGGYTLSYDANFSSFPNSNSFGTSTPIDIFEKALIKWRCATGLNFIINDSIPNLPWENSSASDANKMIVGFEPLSVPGQTTILLRQVCNSSSPKYYVDKFKIKFNINQSWWIEDDTTALIGSSTYLDLESVALHEIGHAHLLNHTTNFFFGIDETMYWTQSTGDVIREIDANNLAGGKYIIDTLLATGSCPYSMIKVTLHCDFTNHTNEQDFQILNVEIFPNPTIDYININLSKIPKQPVEITVFDLTGRELKHKLYNSVRDFKVNISKIPIRVYFLKIKIENAFHTKRIVKL